MRSHADPDATYGSQPGSPQWHQIQSKGLFLVGHNMRAENCDEVVDTYFFIGTF